MNEYNQEVINTVRIPLQLRFERDEMFETLIAPARADRSLTTLIMQLLQAYYYNETVRDIIEQMSQGFTDIEVLQKQVNRVAKAQNASRIMTDMMMSDVDQMYNNTMAPEQKEDNVTVKDMLQQIMLQMTSFNERVHNLEQQATVRTVETVKSAEVINEDTTKVNEDTTKVNEDAVTNDMFIIDEDADVVTQQQNKRRAVHKAVISSTEDITPKNTESHTKVTTVDNAKDNNVGATPAKFVKLSASMAQL